MLKRIPPPVFWIALIVVVFALGYRVFASMQPEETVSDFKPVKAAATPAPAQHAAASPPGRANPPTASPQTPSAVPVRPSQTVALAPQGAVLSPRWTGAPDFAYSGHWEHISGHYDGRTNGSSSRSFRPGSRATLTFTGRFVRIYGVVGPGGGLGSIDIDGRVKRMVDFYAPAKSVHKLVFSSPPLSPGTHRLTLSVIFDQALPIERSHYVNFDGAEISS